jgi:hypothetical protein
LTLRGKDWNDNERILGISGTDNAGKPKLSAIRRVPVPKNTVRSGGNTGEYSQMRAPFGQFSRRDWSAGIGAINGDAEPSRYWFGKGVWTISPNAMILAPSANRIRTPYPYRLMNEPTVMHPIKYEQLGETITKYAWKISPTAAITRVDVMLKVYGLPSEIVLSIHQDNSGLPGALISSDTIQADKLRIGTERYTFNVNCTAGTRFLMLSTYTDTVENQVWIATCDNFTQNGDSGIWNSTPTYMVYVSSGSGWSSGTHSAPVFLAHTAEVAKDWVEFDYRNCKYVASGNKLYRKGDRGVCDSNSADKTKLNDATKNWTANQFTGAVVRIHAGPGVGEWRKVVGNTADALTVDKAFDTEHTTSSEYVIQGAKVLTLVPDNPMGATERIRDAAVSKEAVAYLAMGAANQIRRFREYNNGGTFTTQWAVEAIAGSEPGADFIIEHFDQTDGAILWRAVNGKGFVSKAIATAWGTGLTWKSAIYIDGNNEQEITGIVIYDSKLTVLKMDSIWFVQNDKPQPSSLNIDLQYSLYTGRRPGIMTPYLIFPFGNRVERLYGSIVEDFGPERDNGLPAIYDGVVMDTLPAVGALLIAKDGGRYDELKTPGAGGVFVWRNGGWHTVMTPPVGSSIRMLGYERREDGYDSILIGDASGIWSMDWPRVWDWRLSNDYTADHAICMDGYGISGWYDTDLIVADKWWHWITIFANNLSNERKIRVYYQTSNDELEFTDNLSKNWTYAGQAADTYITHIEIKADGKRIRFLFLLEGEGSSTPAMEAYSVNYISRMESANVLQVTLRFRDEGVDRKGLPNDIGVDNEGVELIDYWARSVKPLAMRSIFKPFDNKEVIIDSHGLVPVEHTPEGLEKHFASFNILFLETPLLQSANYTAIPLYAFDSKKVFYCPDAGLTTAVWQDLSAGLAIGAANIYSMDVDDTGQIVLFTDATSGGCMWARNDGVWDKKDPSINYTDDLSNIVVTPYYEGRMMFLQNNSLKLYDAWGEDTYGVIPNFIDPMYGSVVGKHFISMMRNPDNQEGGYSVSFTNAGYMITKQILPSGGTVMLDTDSGVWGFRCDHNGNGFFAETFGNSVQHVRYRNVYGGPDFSRSINEIGGVSTPPMKIAISPKGDRVMNLVTDGFNPVGLYRMDAPFVGWRQVSTFPGALVDSKPFCVNRYQWLMVGAAGLYLTNDFGDTWQNVSGNLFSIKTAGAVMHLVRPKNG